MLRLGGYHGIGRVHTEISQLCVDVNYILLFSF
jgi:hypothetical protein